jgi:hypothetical protein
MIFDKGAPINDRIELDKDGQTIVDRGKDAWESAEAQRDVGKMDSHRVGNRHWTKSRNAAAQCQ